MKYPVLKITPAMKSLTQVELQDDGSILIGLAKPLEKKVHEHVLTVESYQTGQTGSSVPIVDDARKVILWLSPNNRLKIMIKVDKDLIAQEDRY